LSGVAFNFRRWRVRHSYPKPVVELAVRLMPIHGVAAISRLLDIPMSVIYRWRTKNRDCTPLSANAAADAETLATLVTHCEELVSRLGGYARTTNRRARAPMDAPERVSARASLSNGLPGKAENVAPLRILRDCAERRSDQVDTASAGAAEPASAQVHFGTTAHRYVFDMRKERPERGVRRRMEGVRRVLDTQYFLDIDCGTLAETAQMSLHHFIRMFGDLFGTSPYQYLMRARVEAAKRLLLASSEPIEAIAIGVGFSSGPQLNRAFKHIEGTSISNYCRTLKKSDIGRRPPASTRAATVDAPRPTPV
jgi:AraC-like DNA-binding protein